MATTTKIHMRDIRMRNNAGINFPVCHANEEMLSLEKTRREIVSDINNVTCKHCLKRYPQYYPWATKRNDQ